MTTRLLAAVAVIGALTGCYALQGDGISRVEERDVGDFSSFHVGWGFKADATLGSPARVTIQGDQNIVRIITTTVSAGELRIAVPDGTLLMPVVPVRVTLVSPTLDGLGASGGAHVTAEAAQVDLFTAEASGGSVVSVTGLAAQGLRATGSGGSDVTVKGTTGDAQLEFSGGSEFHGAELTAQTLRFEGSGGSSGTVRVTHTVTGNVSGGSHLTVLGHPQVDVESSGGSSVDVQN